MWTCFIVFLRYTNHWIRVIMMTYSHGFRTTSFLLAGEEYMHEKIWTLNICVIFKQIIENGFNWFLSQINGRKIRLHWLNIHLPIFAQKSSYSSYVECGLDFWEAKGCYGLRFSCNKSGFGTAGFSKNDAEKEI